MTGKGPAHLQCAPNLQGEKNGGGEWLGGALIPPITLSTNPTCLDFCIWPLRQYLLKTVTSRRRNFLLPDKRSTWPRKNTSTIRYNKREFVASFWMLFTGLKKTLPTFVFWGEKILLNNKYWEDEKEIHFLIMVETNEGKSPKIVFEELGIKFKKKKSYLSNFE